MVGTPFDWRLSLSVAGPYVRPLVLLNADEGGFGGTIGALTLLGDGWAVTAGHLLDERDDSAPRTLRYYGAPEAEPVEEVRIGSDLAVLRLEPDPLAGAPGPVWAEDVQAGENLVALGMQATPKGRFIDRERKRLLSPDRAPDVPPWPAEVLVCIVIEGRMMVDAPGLVPMHSGGPFVDPLGRLVSIVTEGGSDATMEAVAGGEVDVPYSEAVAPRALAAQLRQLDVSVTTGGPLRAAWRRMRGKLRG